MEQKNRKWYQSNVGILAIIFLSFFFIAVATASFKDKTPDASVKGDSEVTRDEKQVVDIPFNTLNQDDNTLEEGKQIVKQEGINGKKEKIFKVSFKEGVQISRTLISEKSIQEPVDKIIINGTYVAPSIPFQNQSGDGYINVDGEWVPSPGYYDSAPEDATAECGDGTYSFSQNRRGTCSYHGGVAQWLN